MMRSPYLASNDRLGDVISAIQTLGTYRFYKLKPDSWSERISGDGDQVDSWTKIFRDHPEFFRFSSDDRSVSLVLRRQKPKLFDVDSLEMVTREAQVLNLVILLNFKFQNPLTGLSCREQCQLGYHSLHLY